MENKKNEQKTAQILYITIMLVMLIMALAVGLVTAANRRKAPVEVSEATTTQSQEARTSAVSEIDHTSPSVTTKETPAATTEITRKKPAVTTNATSATSERAAQADLPAEKIPEFIMPTIGDVAKKFSIDALVFSNTMEDYRTHNGIDICANIGDGVMAAADGIVTEIYEHPMMGNTVVIAHDGDAKSVYQNLAEDITVSIGDTVKGGEIIGAVGDSALVEVAEEPHLHFEIMVGGEYKNPLDYISVETMTVVYEE